MSSLTAAHRGYEYQDLFVACRLVDVLLGSVVEVRVDQKLVDDDVFDDLSTRIDAQLDALRSVLDDDLEAFNAIVRELELPPVILPERGLD